MDAAFHMSAAQTVLSRSRRVVVVGAGGNIGSHLVPHLARMNEIDHLTLIDRDRYESRNVQNQAITDWVVGQAKAYVQADVARDIAPDLDVTAIVDDVENVPLGALRGHLLLSCVDSRRTRQFLNQAACRLLIPWIDAGVHADGQLARLDMRRPGADVPCLECGWSDADYAALEQPYGCSDIVDDATPSGSSSSLGALAAALQAMASRRALSLEAPTGTTGSAEQIVIDAAHYRLWRTSLVKNPLCRFCGGGAYPSWCIEPLTLRGDRTLGSLIDQLAWRLAGDTPVALGVAGRLFVSRRACRQCGYEMNGLRLVSAAGSGVSPCDHCQGPAVPSASGAAELLDIATLTAPSRERSLDDLGLRRKDILRVPYGGEDLHFEYRGRDRPMRGAGGNRS